MPVLGINFTKINAERKAALRGKISINNNMIITDVKKHEFKLPDQESLLVEFEFVAKYDPNIGSITINGETIFVDKPKNIEAFVEQWKKDKKLPDEVLAEVMNNLLTRCNVEALVIGREVGLPPTLNMPKVKVNKE